MSSNADKLKALRYTLGLTQSQLAEKIGVSEASIEHCENGLAPIGKVKTPAQSKIKAFLEVQDISPAVIAESKKFLELEDNQKAIQRHFTEGKCYVIYSSQSNTWERGVIRGNANAFLCSCAKRVFTTCSVKSEAAGQERIQMPS